jgi:hypothetical protein
VEEAAEWQEERLAGSRGCLGLGVPRMAGTFRSLPDVQLVIIMPTFGIFLTTQSGSFSTELPTLNHGCPHRNLKPQCCPKKEDGSESSLGDLS